MWDTALCGLPRCPSWLGVLCLPLTPGWVAPALARSDLRHRIWPCLPGTHGFSILYVLSTDQDHTGRASYPVPPHAHTWPCWTRHLA